MSPLPVYVPSSEGGGFNRGGINESYIIISLYLTTQADKLGRRITLVFGAFLKVFTGIFYAFSNNFFILALSGILGVISVSGS